MSLQQIIDDFAAIDDWEERYRYIIDLGRNMKPLAPELRSDAAKVRGCASQVWLVSHASTLPIKGEVLEFAGDSDALIVRGLIALLLQLYSGKSAAEILEIDPHEVLARLGLDTNLSQQRSNGLNSMIERMRADASSSLLGRHDRA